LKKSASNNTNSINQALAQAKDFYHSQGWKMHPFQAQVFTAIEKRNDGMLTAPTGSGKTLALALPYLIQYQQRNTKGEGIELIWISPLRSLSQDLCDAIRKAAKILQIDCTVNVRNGDTPQKERERQKRQAPNILITTPETLHLFFAQKKNDRYLNKVKMIVVDEWHELLGSKRGVQTELALSQLRHYNPNALVWGISATIGNIEEARRVLNYKNQNAVHIVAKIKKKMQFKTLMPKEINEYPWAGHLGTKLMHKALPIIEKSKSTLLFTNTRAQTEIWYQYILQAKPEWAGLMAMHHGSLSKEIRMWVEDALHQGNLKLVVCTSSLDLGVDFAPVESVIQVGSPKGVSRVLQRAGRSGHQPGKTSKLYFLPTHSLELIESAALQLAIKHQAVESQQPWLRCFDVLIQFMVTLAVGEGFKEKDLYQRVLETHCYHSIDRDEWEWMLAFIVYGGNMLESYNEFHKVVVEDDLYKVINRRTAMRHRFSVGTIESDFAMFVKMRNGKRLGSIESSFITRLQEGDAFIFTGKVLELVSIEGNTVIARKSHKKKAPIPIWGGGRMSFSNRVSYWLKHMLRNYEDYHYPEMERIQPLLEVQKELSELPYKKGLLLECMKSEEGFHLFCYPIAGRMIHEGMAMLIAYRLSKLKSLTFSIAMNDYGFELLSDEEIPIEEALEEDLFSTKNLIEDIYQSNNFNQMTEKRFVNIASIAGLLFKGMPNQPAKASHLSTHSKLFFNVFQTYEPDNLLLKQAEQEVVYNQLDHKRMLGLFEDIEQEGVCLQYIAKPTPFCFPIMVDRFREVMTTERIEDRIQRMLDA
jgi:ATP-dependent Lhr-like helicase